MLSVGDKDFAKNVCILECCSQIELDMTLKGETQFVRKKIMIFISGGSCCRIFITPLSPITLFLSQEKKTTQKNVFRDQIQIDER